ncbi:MAG: hypothetical protein QY326_04260 [Bdellovibrionota bacterium]|nr:MAG: hypothetical protein QY326_04260 [Bdellovibrionota bacterium]
MLRQRAIEDAHSQPAEAAASRFAILTLLLAPVIALALVLSFTRSSMKQAALAEEEFWGGPLPQGIRPIHTFRTAEGMIGEFEHIESASELRFVVVPHAEQQSSEGFLSALKRGEVSGYPTLFERYTRAFLNPRRTGPIHTHRLEMRGRSVLVEQVEGLKGWFYMVAVVQGTHEVMEILAIRKGAATPPHYLREVIEQSPRLRSIASSS